MRKSSLEKLYTALSGATGEGLPVDTCQTLLVEFIRAYPDVGTLKQLHQQILGMSDERLCTQYVMIDGDKALATNGHVLIVSTIKSLKSGYYSLDKAKDATYKFEGSKEDFAEFPLWQEACKVDEDFAGCAELNEGGIIFKSTYENSDCALININGVTMEYKYWSLFKHLNPSNIYSDPAGARLIGTCSVGKFVVMGLANYAPQA